MRRIIWSVKLTIEKVIMTIKIMAFLGTSRILRNMIKIKIGDFLFV